MFTITGLWPDKDSAAQHINKQRVGNKKDNPKIKNKKARFCS
jgi:ribonuclease I